MAAAVSTKSNTTNAATNNRGGLRDQQHHALKRHPTESLPLHPSIGNRTISQILRAAGSRRTNTTSPEPSLDVNNGHPLDQPTRELMEARLGYDFGSVRVHSGEQAATSARLLGARAYTVGNQIVFGEGCYAPSSNEGRRLLAHELAHVIQQSRGGTPPTVDPAAAHESSAHQAAAELVSGHSPVQVAGATGVGISRSEDPNAEDPEIERALEPLKESTSATTPAKQTALTPDELIDDHVFGPRAHEEVGDLRKRLAKLETEHRQAPTNAELKSRVETTRRELATLEGKPLDVSAKGTNVPGHGNINTRVAIQIVDKDGNLIALERGRWKPGMHAEEDALAKLRKRLGNTTLPPGSRIVVVGNQVVCSDVCRPALKQFAADYEAESIVAHVRVRPKIVGAGMASGKTTERTGLTKGVPKPEITTDTLYERHMSSAAPSAPKPGKGKAAAATTEEVTTEATTQRPSAQQVVQRRVRDLERELKDIQREQGIHKRVSSDLIEEELREPGGGAHQERRTHDVQEDLRTIADDENRDAGQRTKARELSSTIADLQERERAVREDLRECRVHPDRAVAREQARFANKTTFARQSGTTGPAPTGPSATIGAPASKTRLVRERTAKTSVTAAKPGTEAPSTRSSVHEQMHELQTPKAGGKQAPGGPARQGSPPEFRQPKGSPTSKFLPGQTTPPKFKSQTESSRPPAPESRGGSSGAGTLLRMYEQLMFIQSLLALRDWKDIQKRLAEKPTILGKFTTYEEFTAHVTSVVAGAVGNVQWALSQLPQAKQVGSWVHATLKFTEKIGSGLGHVAALAQAVHALLVLFDSKAKPAAKHEALGGLSSIIAQQGGKIIFTKIAQGVATEGAAALTEAAGGEALATSAGAAGAAAAGALALMVAWFFKGFALIHEAHETGNMQARDMRYAYTWADTVAAALVSRRVAEKPANVGDEKLNAAATQARADALGFLGTLDATQAGSMGKDLRAAFRNEDAVRRALITAIVQARGYRGLKFDEGNRLLPGSLFRAVQGAAAPPTDT